MSSDLLKACCAAAVFGITAAGAAVRSAHPSVGATSTGADCLTSFASASWTRPRMRVVKQGEAAVAIEISGLDSTLVAELTSARLSDRVWSEAFDVRVASADSSLPSMAGLYGVVGRDIRFRPPFPLIPGETYRVRLDDARVHVLPRRSTPRRDCVPSPRLAIDTSFVVPNARDRRQPEVTAVYPTVDTLPMNQLKMYVHFSTPMRTGEFAAHARIIDEADGQVVTDAFYSPEDELWNPSQTRLTMLFDPGRIKRGLRPNQEEGLPLREGRRYDLVIDRGWRDANGDSLRARAVKRFIVAAPDRAAPRPATWSVTSPRAGTLDTLTIAFGEPMDEALLERVLVVRDVGGRSLGGRTIVGRGEATWHFVPTEPWRDAPYVVDVGTELEDLAGNNLRRLFDTDLREPRAPALARGDRVSLPVTISRPASTTPIISGRTPQLPDGRRPTLGVSVAGAAQTPAWLHVGTPDLRSAEILTFAPDGLLLIGDSRGSAVFAVDIADSGSVTSANVAVTDLDAKLAARLGTTARDISVRDMAVHPMSHNVYLSVLRTRDDRVAPVLVRISGGGQMDVVSLSSVRFARAALPNPPRPGVEIEGDAGWKWTISGMTVMDGSHFLVAAYSCTPLVLLPVDSLQDGAKVTGRTIAELGAGNILRDILPFDWEGKRYLAVSNRNRSMQLLNATALPNVTPLDGHSPNPTATVIYGLGSWLSWGLEAGSIAQVGVLHLADFDADNALVVQRDTETGALNLRLLKKPILFP